MVVTVSNKILIVLQFWSGDKANAMRLARFLADIEPEKCPNADLLLVSRYDCSQDEETVKYVAKKFNVHTHRSRRRGTGWPHGCNELFFGSMEWVYSMMQANRVPQYKAIFTCESDGAPLQSNWIKHFSRGWSRLQETSKPVYVAGALVPHPAEHVNGNCFFSGNLKFLHWMVRLIGGAPSGCGWDYYLREDFKKWGWAQLPGLRSYWGQKTMSEEGYRKEVSDGTVWLHGVKDDSFYNFTRKTLLVK
jgi:hypothetical protein